MSKAHLATLAAMALKLAFIKPEASFTTRVMKVVYYFLAFNLD